MVAVGLILVFVALGGGGFVAWMSLQETLAVYIGPSGFRVGLLPITLFASGAATMLLLWLGVRLTAVGARRRSAERQQLKELRSGLQAQGRRDDAPPPPQG